MKKILIAAGAALMLAVSVPSVASAQWGFHHGFHGFHHGFFGPRIGFRIGVAPYAFASCRRVERVWTPFGWHWRRVWVC